MKKVKLLVAGAFIVLGAVTLPQSTQASNCNACSDNDGKCRSGNVSGCADEKAWYEEWDCITGGSGQLECD